MGVHWYPGHMVKAKRNLQKALKLVDIVIEVLDARIPYSSRNPDIKKLINDKKAVVVLNKEDLADEDVTFRWMEYLNKKREKAVAVNSLTSKGIEQIINYIDEIQGHDKGFKKIVKGIIIGIPNVGKSSLINQLSKKSSAKTGNRPGITKGEQWINVKKGFRLLDTPGILWPKFQSPDIGVKLAITGAIRDELFDVEEVAVGFINIVLKLNYLNKLEERYGLCLKGMESFKILEEVGRKRGCLLKGGCIDTLKAAGLLLKDYRMGKLGRLSLEIP